MTNESEKHVTQIITDYVLELLPRAEHQAAAQHIARCVSCRQAVLRERQIGQAVKQTLTMATERHRELKTKGMPGVVVNQHGFRRILKQGQKQLLLVSCLFILTFATLGLQVRFQQKSWLATEPAVLTTSVLRTGTPTATILATAAGTETISPTPSSMKSISLPMAAQAPVAVYPEQKANISVQQSY